MKPLAILAAAALLVTLVPAGTSQVEPGLCGDIQLIFMNPDLMPRDDGFIHASGTFFAQFQAIGPSAASVAKIAFGFGKPIPDPVASCDTPVEPLTGVEIRNYRVDADARDGFFVAINTTFVPDGEYSASLTAFDGSGNYLARFFAKAIVENGPNCNRDRVCVDRTMPWPMILPGDGEQTNAVGGITIEFAEFVQDVAVKINGDQVIPRGWTPPARDDDAQPDNDGGDCGTFEAVRFLPVCRRVIWGSGFHIDREPQAGDVVEVKAIDLAGNEWTKIVNIGGATQGGAIELVEPELRLTSDTTELEVEAGQTAEYRIRLSNVGQGVAEARMTVQSPNGTVIEWDSPSISVPPGGEQTVTLRATPGKDMRPGGYTLVSKATYKSGTADQEKQLPLTLRVTEFRPVPESPIRQSRANLSRTAAEPEDQGRSTPGAEPVLAAGLLAAVALVERGRRRRA